MKARLKIITLLVLLVCSFVALAQPTGKAAEIINLINEARINPKAFILKYKTSINQYEPKLITILEKASPIPKIIWDEELAKNCKQKVYGTLNPTYKGVHKMCGSSSGNGSGYSSMEAIYFVCTFYTHIMDEAELYFGFYIDPKGHAFWWGHSCDTKLKYLFEFKQSIDSSKVDLKKINTAVDEKELTLMDKEMIKEINFARQYPKVYVSIVGKYLANESATWGLSKAEYDAGLELIEELNVMKAVQILYPKKCVYDAAKKHGEDCKKRGFIDHTGSDGSSPFSRISKYCDDLNGNENLVGGSSNARNLVIQLLIDSGISSRGHRYNMLDPKWKYVGCYGYKSEIWYYVQNFATD